MDQLVLEVLWNRLISVVNEQAAALMRTSFTSIVREAGDLSAGVFDRRGRMIAQAVTGTPGHINPMATCMHHFLAKYPVDTPAPGRRPGDQRPLEDRLAAQRHHHRHADLQRRSAGRAVRQLLPCARHRRPRPVGRFARGVRGRPVHPGAQAVRRRRAGRAGVRVPARERAHARGGAGRRALAGGRQRGRRPPARLLPR